MTEWLREGPPKAGAWLRANKLKALVLFLALNVLSATARMLLDGASAFIVGFAFLFLAILVGVTYLQGGRSF